jgi:hypothetical protein
MLLFRAFSHVISLSKIYFKNASLISQPALSFALLSLGRWFFYLAAITSCLASFIVCYKLIKHSLSLSPLCEGILHALQSFSFALPNRE